MENISDTLKVLILKQYALYACLSTYCLISSNEIDVDSNSVNIIHGREQLVILCSMRMKKKGDDMAKASISHGSFRHSLSFLTQEPILLEDVYLNKNKTIAAATIDKGKPSQGPYDVSNLVEGTFDGIPIRKVR